MKTMEKWHYESVIKSIANNPDAIDLYLTAEWGFDFRVWSDGTFDRIESNNYDQSEAHPTMDDDPIVISRVKCPGLYNMDSTEFTEGFASQREDGQYVVTGDYHEDQGRIVGNLKDVVRECIAEGDMSRFADNLEEKLMDNYRERGLK
jgi:hypothetical protein